MNAVSVPHWVMSQIFSVMSSNLFFKDFDDISIFHFQHLGCVLIMYDRPIHEETFPNLGDSMALAPGVN